MEENDMTERRARVLTDGRGQDHALHCDTDAVDSLMTRLGQRAQVKGGCYILDGDRDTYLRVVTPWGRSTAHRFVYEQVNGIYLDSDSHVHHTCEQPGCINPAHLAAMSASDHASLHARARS
jgi:hypothetical protein